MDEQSTQQALTWILVIGLIGVLGIGMVLALLAAWRSYNNRQRLLDEGKRLRDEFSGRSKSPSTADAWTEAGRRYHDDERRAFSSDADETALIDPSDIEENTSLDRDDESEADSIDAEDEDEEKRDDPDDSRSDSDDDETEDTDDDTDGPRNR